MTPEQEVEQEVMRIFENVRVNELERQLIQAACEKIFAMGVIHGGRDYREGIKAAYDAEARRTKISRE